MEIGKGEIVREGSSIAVLAIGTMVQRSVEAARILEEEGIDALVANMRFLKPLDTVLLDSIAKQHDTIVVIEENSIIGGLGSAVSDHLQKKRLTNNVMKIGLPDSFVTHGSMNDLYRLLKLDAENISRQISTFYKGTATEKSERVQSTIRTERLA